MHQLYLFIGRAASANEHHMKTGQTNYRNCQQTNDNHFTQTASS